MQVCFKASWERNMQLYTPNSWTLSWILLEVFLFQSACRTAVCNRCFPSRIPKCVCVCECQWHGLHFLSSPPSSFLISLVSSGCPFLFLCCQVKTEISVESKHQTLQGLAFPLQPEAQQAIQLLKQKKINYIQLVRTEPPL